MPGPSLGRRNYDASRNRRIDYAAPSPYGPGANYAGGPTAYPGTPGYSSSGVRNGNTYRPPNYHNPLAPTTNQQQVEYLKAVAAQQQRIAKLQSDAKRYATVYLERAKALERAAAGAHNSFIQRLGSYYGIDYSTPQGRKAAKQIAHRLRSLATNSYVGPDGDTTGAEQLVQFEEQARKGIMQQRNAQAEAAHRAVKDAKANDNWLSPGAWLHNAGEGVTKGLEGLSWLGQHVVNPAAGYVERLAGSAWENSVGAFQSVAKYGPAGNPQYTQAATGGLAVPPTNAPGSHGLVTKQEQADALQQYRQDVIHGVSGAQLVQRAGVDDPLAQAVGGVAIDIGLDPLTYALPRIDALKDLANVATAGGLGKATLSLGGRLGKADQLANRVKFITETKVGRAAVESAAGRVRNAATIEEATKALGRDVPREVVNDVIRAGKEGGSEAAHKVLQDAFAHGLWQPTEGVTSQVLQKAGLSGHIGGEPGAISRSLRDIIGARKTIEGERVLRVPVSFAGVDSVLDEGIGIAADLNKSWAGDLVRAVANNNAGRDAASRAASLVVDAERLGDPGFTTLVDEAMTVGSGRGAVSLNTTLFEDMPPAAQKVFADRLDKLEAYASVLKGEQGEAARKALTDQIRRQYSLPTEATAAGLIGKAVKTRAGQDLLRGQAYRKIEPEYAQAVLDDLPDSPLKTALGEELTAAEVGSAKYGTVLAAIDKVQAYPYLLEDATRAIELNGARAGLQETLRKAALLDVPAHSKLFRGTAKLALSVIEKRPLNILKTLSSPFKGVNEAAITEYMDRYASTLGLSSVERRALNREALSVAEKVARGQSPQKAIDLYHKIVQLGFEKFGLPREMSEQFFKDSVKNARTAQAFGLDDAGELITRPVVASQAQTQFFLKNPDALMDKIRETLAANGDEWAKAMVRWDATKNRTLFSMFGKQFTIEGGLKEAERFWKVMITTRAYAPLIGATAGFAKGVSDGDDMWDSLQSAGTGLLIGTGVGAVGLARYIERNYIQARISSVLYHGMTPEEIVPGLSRIFMRYQKAEYGAGANFLASNAADGFFINGGLSRTATGSWEVLERTPKNLREFVREYHRILNFQVNPETDEMMRLLLQRRAGHITEEQFTKSANEFIGSEAGSDWANKMRGVGIKRPSVAVKRYEEWVNRYVSPEMAQARLAPEAFGPGKAISEAQLLKDPELLPTAVHRQATESVFKKGPINGLITRWTRFANRAAYDAPALNGVKRAFYDTEARRLEQHFLASGVGESKAVEYAGEIATRNTNELMFRIENTSRFSAKVDFISPFQGHREYNTRTWLRLASERPGHTALYGLNAAKAFNGGVKSGIFQKDPFTGQWTLSVPGSAPLSRALFGGPAVDFNVNLSGFLAMTEGGLSPDGDTSNPWLAAATAAIPRPGGPFWSIAAGEFAKHFPEITTAMPPGLRNVIYGPVGPSTRFLPADTDRLWQAIAGSTPPWNFLAEDEQKNDTARWELEVARQLIVEHRKADLAAGRPVDTNWIPDDDAVKENVQNFFLAWGFLRGLMPAAPHPVFRDKGEFEDLLDHFIAKKAAGSGMTPSEYRDANYTAVKREFIDSHPAFAPYFDASTKYVGPDDLRHWETGFSGPENAYLEKQLGLRREIRWPEYKAFLKEQARLHKGYEALTNAENFQGSRYEREAHMEKWRNDFPDINKYLRSRYFAQKELANILRTYPDGDVKERALDRWRHQYAPKGSETISHNSYIKMVADIKKKKFLTNPWAEARDSEVVWADTQKKVGHLAPTNLQVIAYVRQHLSPAEQMRYWTQAVMHLSYVNGGNEDPYKVNSAYSLYTNEMRTLYNNPVLKTYIRSDRSIVKANDPYALEVSKWKGDQATLTYNLGQEAYNASQGSEAAYQRGDYATSKMLSQRAKSLYAQLAEVKNAAWHGMKDEKWMHDQARELAYFHDIGKLSDHEYALKLERANQKDQFNVKFIPSNEEAHFLAMPAPVRAAYIDNIVHRLAIPPGESKARYALIDNNPDANPFSIFNEGVPTKMYWSYLTNFQRSQIEKFFPPEVVDGWKNQDPSMEKSSGKGGYGRGGYSRYGRGGSAQDELSFAYSLMREYNKRGGMAKPAAYDEYLALPNNPAVRNDFLDKHPDVAAYVSAGPMHNMPPYYQMMVQQIMIKNGKWDGELLDAQGLADLAFAKTQLQLYNRRGDAKAPATYDLWLNMPSGQAKAQYLQDHPEIRQWLQLGPMANMPDIYREVVRDIMLRYHQWTASTDDGLGPVLQAYYRTPSWARQQYLLDHPELVSYWQATSSPEDLAMSNLTDQFYAIPDPAARQAFLAAHPELQQHLVEARTQRYERFLNQVAVYMGQNPALFEHYLSDQTEVLKDLLNKFAEPNLAGETHWMAPKKASTKSSEGGRRRG